VRNDKSVSFAFPDTGADPVRRDPLTFRFERNVPRWSQRPLLDRVRGQRCRFSTQTTTALYAFRARWCAPHVTLIIASCRKLPEFPSPVCHARHGPPIAPRRRNVAT